VVDRVADRVALFMWRALLCSSVLLLVVVLAVLVIDVLLPGALTGEPGTGPEVARLAPTHAASSSGVAASGFQPVAPAPSTPSPTPTVPLLVPTLTPLAPALPHAGQLAARADSEPVLGLASQARWERARSTAVPTETPTPVEPPPTPTPTPSPMPSPTAIVAQPPMRIVAPSIRLDARVVPVKWKKINEGGREVLSWVVPKNDAGWHFTSALPGQPGNTVLTGHRNIYAEVFRYIVDLKPGDPITLYAGDQAFVYYVDEQHVVQEVGVPASVRAENAKWIARTDDTRLTLVTCAPYEAPGNTHRVIVVARP
jgi:LPXTG-site transpeptidase (sortase) family protein